MNKKSLGKRAKEFEQEVAEETGADPKDIVITREIHDGVEYWEAKLRD